MRITENSHLTAEMNGSQSKQKCKNKAGETKGKTEPDGQKVS